MIRNIFLLLSILLSTVYIITAQPVNTLYGDVVMPAPNAAALGKYGDIPVSTYTGVPNISIPLHTMTDGPLSIPISLSYHASGIRVGEMASWVGLGWSLNAGGIISRTVQGIPDEGAGGYMNMGDQIPDQFSLENQFLYEEIKSGQKDGEPDIFSFNVAGAAGKFYITPDEEVVLIPEQDVQIEFKLKANTSDITRLYQFTVVTNDGTRYYFGRDPQNSANEPIEYTESPGGNPYASSWYLTRVESYDRRNTIELTYEDEVYAYSSMATRNSRNTSGQDRWNFQIVSGKRLATIETPTQEAIFVANTDREDLSDYSGYSIMAGQFSGPGKRLDRIDLQSKNGGPFCKSFDLTYDYYQAGSYSYLPGFPSGGDASVSAKRLQLKAVQERTCAGAPSTISIPPYSFTYAGPQNGNGQNIFPHRLSRAVDHWGYYNGAVANNTNYGTVVNAPPTETYNIVNGNAVLANVIGSSDRESNETYMKHGVLEKITYPTGGFTEFTFGANEVTGTVTTDDGVKIDQLYDCFTNPGSAEFTPPFSFHSQLDLDNATFYFALEPANVGSVCYQDPQSGLTEAIITFVDDAGTEITQPVQLNGLGSAQGDVATTFPELVPNVTYRIKFDRQYTKLYLNVTGIPQTTQGKREVGGLRIEQIKSHDGISSTNDVIKTYNYDYTNGISSGALFNQPRYDVNILLTRYWGDCLYIPSSIGGSTAICLQQPYLPDDTSEAPTLGSSVYSAVHENSLTPLSSFEGYHIGYAQVIEDHNGNGRKTFVYHTEQSYTPGIAPEYPVPPAQARISSGKLLAETHSTDSGNPVYSMSNLPVSDQYSTSNYNIVKILPIPTTILTSVRTFYQIRTRPYRLALVSEVIDGVATTTTYEYDPLNQHLSPVTTTQINSDGTAYRTQNKYVFDVDDFSDGGGSSIGVDPEVYQTMISLNKIGMPIETIQEVETAPGSGNFAVVSGTHNQYRFFNASGIPATKANSDSTSIYLYKQHIFEATFDVAGTYSADGWDELIRVSEIDAITGKPETFILRGWDPEYYTWDAVNKKIRQRQFQGFTWQYNYHPGSILPASQTDIDGQSITYTFDPLMRLTSVSERNGNVVTEYDYQYQSGSGLDNYVHTRTILSGVPNSSFDGEDVFAYFDGLGRPIQTVIQAHSPNQQDVVTATEYDAYGRPFKQYEPFESSFSDGSRVAVPAGTPFTLTTFEASPLNRTLSVTPPEWNTTTYDYGSNPSSLTIAGVTYPGGSLKMETITDPNGNHSITYTDRRGRQVRTVRRKDDGSAETKTDYQYDPKDRVRKIVPPGSTTSDLGLNYEYLYDGRDRIIQKKIPDQGWIDYAYDERDLPTAMRDARMRTDGRWLQTHYDSYGRATATGFINQGGMIDGGIVYSLSDSLSRTWYDGQGLNVTDPIYTGKVSRIRSRILGSTDFLETRTYYDAYGRMSETRSNHIGRLSDTQAEVFTYSYDFADNITHTYRDHRRPDGTLLPLHDRMTYDHAGRQIDHYLTIDGQQEHLSRQAYTIKDELKEKNLGGTAALQSLDYAYRANGFLRGINHVQTEPGDLFRLGLHYAQPDGTTISGFTPQYNGNIGALSWQTGTGNEQIYRYTYDYLDRLQTAALQQNGSPTPAYSSSYSYDVRGNLTTLNRNNVQGSAADVLTYNYLSASNLLSTMQDAGTAEGFSTGNAAPGATYGYDLNGNLTADPYKNLNIVYNHLNLPDTIIQPGSNNRIVWFYDAAGNKLRKEVYTDELILNGTLQDKTYRANTIRSSAQAPANSTVTLEGRDSVVLGPGSEILAGSEFTTRIDPTLVPVDQTDYIGGIEYRNGGIEAVYHPEGRAVPDGTTWRHEYVITDHLGNTRLRFSDLDGSGTIDSTELLSTHDYYPFGLEWQDGGYKYTYNGKEKNAELGVSWLDFGARQYDPTLGRFTSIDPLGETMPSVSSYSFGFNNPIAFSDPTGMIPYRYNWDEERYEDQDGNEVSWQTVHGYIQENNETANDMAVLVAFPEDSPRIPSNQKLARWFEKTFGDGDGKVQGAGHAGIVLVDGESGYLRYFDFGRYNRPDLAGTRGENEGAVRSSNNYRALRLNFDWDFSKTDDENITRILSTLHQSPLLNGYGTIAGALVKGVDYDAMLAYAQEMENQGYQPFGGYTSSCTIGNATYCAKFVRGVAGAGGMSFAPGTFTGLANLKEARRKSGSNIITIP